MNGNVWRRRARGYTVAIGAVLLATGLKILISSIAPLPPFILYFGAVILVAIYAGRKPGMLAVLLSSLLAWYFFIPPLNSFQIKPESLFQLGIFVVESVLMVHISASLKSAKETMTWSEKRFRSILEKSQEGITLRTKSGELLYMSLTTKQFVGYTFAQYKKVNPRTLVLQEDLASYLAVYEKVLAKPFLSKTVTYRIKTKKGQMWIEDTITNLLEDPAVGAVVSNFRNVSDRMELEERRNNFLNMASHELKTPLTSINVFSEILHKHLLQTHDMQSIKYIEKIKAQLYHMTSLVQELLDVTRMQQGSLKIEKEKFSLKDLVQEIVEDLQLTTNQELVLNLQTKSSIYADRERIRQVLTNLITNAIKYSQKGKQIVISAKNYGNNLVVSVQDFGIGIPKSEQKKIFERFYQVKNHATYPGLGLGLFISTQILKQHKGKMWVKSREGKGATFSFSLPIVYAG